MSPASKAAGSMFIFSRSINLLLKISSYAALATLKTGQAPYLNRNACFYQKKCEKYINDAYILQIGGCLFRIETKRRKMYTIF